MNGDESVATQVAIGRSQARNANFLKENRNGSLQAYAGALPKSPRADVKEETPRRRRAGGLRAGLETLSRDLRFGLRTLARNRGFTTVAVLILALGIGANTAMFSVVHGVIFAPLSFPEADGQTY